MSEFQSGTGPTPERVEEIRRYRLSVLEYGSMTEQDSAAIADLLAAYDVMKQQRDEAVAAHELMAKQFRIMQAEKEHGWREAEDARQDLADQQVVLSEAFSTVERVRKAESWDEIHAALHSEGS